MIQKIIDILFRNPRSQLKTYNRFGGYFAYRKMMRERQLMEIQSALLPPVKSIPGSLPIYFLTGKRYLYQTLYCIASLNKATSTDFEFILIDDGSFDDAIITRIHQQLPGATIFTQTAINRHLQAQLPPNLYSAVYDKRAVYPHLKKITDVHVLPGKNWKLVLDSDMLFLRSPEIIIKWLKNPIRPIHMVDCVEAYGYSPNLMQQLTGMAIKPLINVGVIGLNSNSINWKLLESWITQLETAEGASYYLEQALTAMLIGDNACTVLPVSDYIVNPNTDAVKNNIGILHHYVDLSKADYFKYAWKKVIHPVNELR